MKQHKWAKEIKAWADDDQCIEVCKAGIWYSTDYPNWNFKDEQFRIKPQPKEPQYLYVYMNDGGVLFSKELNETFKHRYRGKIKLEVDDEE